MNNQHETSLEFKHLQMVKGILSNQKLKTTRMEGDKMSATTINHTKAKHDWGLFFLGIICIAASLAIVAWPGISMFTITIIAGIVLCVAGVWDFVLYSNLKGTVSGAGWYIASGICDIILGALFLLNPIATAEMLPWLAGIFVIAYGIAACFSGIGFSSFTGAWALMLLNGILSVIIGIMFLTMPGSFILFISIYLAFRGVMMCIYGIVAPNSISAM